MDGCSLIVAKTANSLVPYFTDEADIRSKRSMETKDSPPVTASTPVFKTLKAALLYPEPLRRKYSGSLNNSLGSVENYLLIVANMVCINCFPFPFGSFLQNQSTDRLLFTIQ